MSSQRISNPNRSGLFELCVTNPDKGGISRDEIEARLKPFEDKGLPVVLTDAARFTDKAKLFRGARFVLGYGPYASLLRPLVSCLKEIVFTRLAFIHVAGSCGAGMTQRFG